MRLEGRAETVALRFCRPPSICTVESVAGAQNGIFPRSCLPQKQSHPSSLATISLPWTGTKCEVPDAPTPQSQAAKRLCQDYWLATLKFMLKPQLVGRVSREGGRLLGKKEASPPTPLPLES